MNPLKGITRVSLARLASSILMFGMGTVFVLVDVEKSSAQPAVPSGTNGVLLEYWLDLGDSSLIAGLTRSPNFPLNPSGKMIRGDFQGLTDFGEAYGTRMRGWLVPPVTGDYIFYLTADDTGELWLSSDDNPTHKRRIASAAFISTEWDMYPEQKSAAIRLEAGKAYYIEALHKQGIYSDHLAVAWRIPGTTVLEVIPGRCLIPYNNGLGGEGITQEVWTNINDVAVAEPAASEQEMQFEATSELVDNSGQRLRGYVHPPTNGYYTFWVAGNASAVLSLSSDGTPGQRWEIAQVTQPTGPREWERNAEQRSAAIYLEGGKTYYIEALQKEGNGTNYLSVAWQLPDGTMEGPIPASRLTPYDSDGDGMPDWYERQEGFDAYNPDDAAQDSDFDGVSNLDEFKRGTNPHFDETRGVWRGMLLEYWFGLDTSRGIEGLTHNPRFPSSPSMRILRTDFEIPTDIADGYGTRMRGWLTPPVTGDYTFWVAADDASELWLSQDNNPANKQRIASAPAYTEPHEWNKYPEQRSATIRLEAGKAYYIESLHKEGTQRDHLAVAWLVPGNSGPEVISARYLTPYNEEGMVTWTGINQVSASALTSGNEVRISEGLTREIWTNLNAVAVSDPAVSEQVPQFEAPSDRVDNYGQRLRGYIHPPTNGNYTFWIAADAAAVLSLSTNDTPALCRNIARVTQATGLREWERNAEQCSAAIYLEGGKTYYIEALQREGNGTNYLSVAWQLPDGTVEGPIPTSRLTPYDSDGDGMPDWYERQEGFDPYNPDDAAQDSDFDGVSNLDEFKQGTNPHFDETRGVWRGVLVEYWLGLDTTTSVEDLTRSPDFPLNPSGRVLRANFEGLMDFAEGYGTRVRAWLTPLVTGDYTFWIEADDKGELWLSGDDNPAHKRQIASAPAATSLREWTRYSEQCSAPIRLEAGKAYYIEALHKQGTKRDHVAVAWQVPGGNGPELISARYLIPFNNGQGGEGISREVWTNIMGAAVVDLTTSAAFKRGADVQQEITQFEAPSNWGHNYGQRIQGYIHPPTNGNYTFWVAADASAVLSLSLDDTPMQGREIAQVTTATGPREWKRNAEQQSAAIYLEGGKMYYIEALHKGGTGSDHLSVAWQLPDGTMEGPIPASRLTPYDSDGDGLPDWYETRHGFNPYNPDDANQDADSDGLSNLQEFQLGTDPTQWDTFGNGLPDGLEVLLTGTNLNVSGALVTTKVASIPGAQGQAVLGQWQVDGTDLYALNRRGAVEFTLSTTNADKYLLKLEGTQNQPGSPVSTFDVVLSVDGENLGHHMLTAPYGTNGVTPYVTPFLLAGSHTVRVFWDGAASVSSLRIKQVTLETIADPPNTPSARQRGGGANGLKYWVEKVLNIESGLDTNSPTASYVSPVCLEGRDPYLSLMRISDAERTTNVALIYLNAGARWYANVPLSAQTDTKIVLSYQNGGKSEERTLHWQPINVLETTNLVIRAGDSLLLAAPSEAQGKVQITVSDDAGTVTNFTTTAPRPVPCQFAHSGSFVVTVTYNSRDLHASQIGRMNVKVIGYAFPVDPVCMVNRLRIWELTNVPPEIYLDADPRLKTTEVDGLPDYGRRLGLVADQNEPRGIVSRAGLHGPIVASARTTGVRLFGTPDTYNWIVEKYADGSQLVETMKVLSPVLTNVVVQISIVVGGVTFDDGTTYRELAPGDFDQLGQCKVRFFMPAGTETANCHMTRMKQGAVLVGTY